MRTIRFSVIGATLLVAVACGTQQESRQAAPAATQGRTVATAQDAQLTPTDLAMFAPLPARMDAPGQPPSDAEIALGRTLYYETLLSNGHDVSCNSCHALNGYGADGRRVSFGHKGQEGSRNSPTVYNAAGQVAQFWDGRAPNVEEQAKGPILNPAEMGMPGSSAVLDHLKASAKYRAAFAAAFPGQPNPVTYDNVGRAIGAFERGLVTPSRWDAFLKGDTAALTAQEKRGAKTFIAAGCTACHAGAYVGGQLFQKAGLVRAWPTTADSGRIAVTKAASDLFVFKVPTLRNVAKTGPYFSDGSVGSLDSAIVMMGRYQLGVDLTPAQVQDIRAFLGTLTGEIPVRYVAEPPLPAGAAF
ncbi:MAG TPA: cytochrome c peroxidase [Gemmatimonadaceae bacterium]|nr:cytochrome c peroxidase [Gemmatimonadaceae bacterium]